MKRTSARTLLFLLPVFILATAALFSQTTKTNKGFVIDDNKPFVYVRFDHTGPGVPRDEDEQATRIWLRLVNNCRVPIVVTANGVPDESPKEEVGLRYQIVANPLVYGSGGAIYRQASGEKSGDHKADDSSNSDEQTAAMPRNDLVDVASFISIGPGEQILFSMPVNHLGKHWHVEIPFEFDLPRGKCCRDDKTGGMPLMRVDYGLYDLPPQAQTQLPTK
jgi:hypothetical protein